MTRTEGRTPKDEDDGRVAEVFGCPRCGERRMDWLEWIGDDMEDVECATCTFVFSPMND